MKNKDRVYQSLKQYEQTREENDEPGLTTQEISQMLEMQRANVSTILNRLVDENLIEKSTGRPVRYWTKELKMQSLDDSSCFDTLVGHDGSLKNAVELSKAAVLYPRSGLNVLIIGEKGVGKSSFASLVYQYAMDQGVLSQNAPFLRLNCKNYIEHEEELTQDLFAHKEDNYFDKAENGVLFIDSVDLLSGKDRARLITFMENQEYTYLEEEEAVKKNVALILACDENANHEIIEHFEQKIMLTIKLPNLTSRPLKERFELMNHFFKIEAIQANQTFEVTNEVIRCLLLLEYPGNIRQLESNIKLACANAFVRNRSNPDDKNILIVMSDFKDNIRQGLLNYKKHYLEIEKIIPDDFNYVFSKENTIEKSSIPYHEKDSLYEIIEKKVNELKGRGLTDEEIDLITSSHIQTMFDHYQKYLNKQAMNIGQLSKIVDPSIIQTVQRFLDIAQEKFNASYPVSLYYSLSLHVGALVDSPQRSQKLGNKQIIDIISQYNDEYIYCLQFINELEEKYRISIPVDEAVILTMFLIKQENSDLSGKPVVLVAMHGNQAASGIAQVINTLVKANNTYGFDMSLDSEPKDVYEELKEFVLTINQGKGVIAFYDMGSFKDMFMSIEKETKIDIRLVYVPITLMGIEVSRRVSLDEDIDMVYHQLIQSARGLLESEFESYPCSVIVTLCNTGEGGAQELKKYIELNAIKEREIIPLAISDRKELVNQIRGIMESKQIHCFVGTYDPNLFGIPFISIQEVLECDSFQLDRLLDFNVVDTETVDMKAIYEYLDDSLEYVDVKKIKKLLPPLIENIEKDSGEKLSTDQRLGLLVHIACSINRTLAKEPTPTNIKRNQIFKKYEQLVKNIMKSFKPVEKDFGIIVNDDEIANVICIVKKL